MWIQREIWPDLERLARQRPALVVTGARQTGKTTLLRRLFPDHGYVSLDLPAAAAEAERSPETFLDRYGSPLLIDEVQYAPALFRHLKLRIDAARDVAGQFILSGSQKFELMREVADSLAGRVAVVELPPLSYAEIKGSGALEGAVALEAAIVRGGYPELYRVPALDHAEYYASYVATYLERDVRSLLAVGNLRDFDRFVRACALRSGNVLNKADLARDVGISPSTANEWLSVLEASGQALLLQPWFANATRSLTKSPKLYLTDTGLMCFLLGVRDEAALRDSPYRGAIFETFVANELIKRHQRSRPGEPVYFWRDRGKEVDFVLHTGGRFELIEAKWAELPSSRDTAGFAAFERSQAEGSVERRTIVCRTSAPAPLGDAIAVNADEPWFSAS